MHFENKVAVITGGAGGIGRCIAESFLAQGAFVAIADTNSIAGEHMAQQHGEKLLFHHGDIADKNVLDAFIRALTARFAQVDFLINNAMCSKGGILSGCDYDDFTYALQLGVTAPYYLSLGLKDRFGEGAAIVNISSSRSGQSQSDTESYSAAKGGIAALTHALSVSLAGTARVNAVAPGWIETAGWHDDDKPAQHSEADKLQHPVQRVGTPEDIAAMVLFLCSEQAGFVSGQEILVDGGMSKLMIYHDDRGWRYTPQS